MTYSRETTDGAVNTLIEFCNEQTAGGGCLECPYFIFREGNYPCPIEGLTDIIDLSDLRHV
jgi:hypothetical protein